MKTCIISCFTGLSTDPGWNGPGPATQAVESDPTHACLGMRRLAAKIAGALDSLRLGLTTIEAEFNSYSMFPAQQGRGWQPCDWLERMCTYDLRIMIGHSFGLACIKWLADNARCADDDKFRDFIHSVVNLDGAPNIDRYMQFYSWAITDCFPRSRWRIAHNVVQSSISVYQRNDKTLIPGLGVCGIPFANQFDWPLQDSTPIHETVNASALVDHNGKKLGHVSLVDNDTVHTKVIASVSAVAIRAEKQYQMGKA